MEFVSELKDARMRAEMIYVASLYKNPRLYEEYRIGANHFVTGSPWKFFYGILGNMVKDNDYEALNHLIVDIFINDKMPESVQKKYVEFGGYEQIGEVISLVECDNIKQHYNDVLKYSALHNLHQEGFDVEKRWDLLQKLDFRQVSNYFADVNKRMFKDFDIEEDKVTDIKDGAREMLDNAYAGVNVGLPVNSTLLNNIINGQILGNLSVLAAQSGVGKTTLSICLTLPQMIKNNVKVLIMCNEEDKGRWQQQLLTWIANNVICRQEKHYHLFEKSKFFQGNFTAEEKEIMEKSYDFLQEKVKDGLIKIVSFSSFSMDKTIRYVDKYSREGGVKYFILDTFKLDNDASSKVTDNAWLQLQQNIVKLHNVIKTSENNVHVWLTYQLGKTNRLFLDQTSLGNSKNVADVVSTLMLTRMVTTKEKQDNSLKVISSTGEEKILNPKLEYMIVFVDKNRAGTTAQQVVLEVDKGKNVIRDVGYTRVLEDY